MAKGTRAIDETQRLKDSALDRNYITNNKNTKHKMNITPDYLIERKRTKRQLTKWKIFALLLILGMFFVGRGSLPNAEKLTKSSFAASDHIASIRINDVIMDDLDRVRRLEKIEGNDNIKALIVNINSPGGSVVGSEMLYKSLRKMSRSKPVVVVMGSVAASGGYLAALGGDYIIAHNGTITGSIGVIMQSAEMTELAEKLGVKFHNFKSNALKAAPNPMEKLTPEVKEATMESVYEVYDFFVEMVAERRNLDLEYVKKIADGRVYSGRKAYKLKLIDEVGDEDSALKWLHEKREISKDLKVVDMKINPKERLIDIIMEDLQTSVSSLFSYSFKGLKSII